MRAALAIQHALGEISARSAGKASALVARNGLDSGPVVVDAAGEVFGEAPNIAARVQGVAEPGSLLITLNMQRKVAGRFLAEERDARELNGVSGPVRLSGPIAQAVSVVGAAAERKPSLLAAKKN